MSTERIDVEALRGHTPGEWEVVHDHPQNACCSVSLKDRHLAAEIATLYWSSSSPEKPVGGIWPDDPERTANANLIAAAPALLAEVIERRARDAELIADLRQAIDDVKIVRRVEGDDLELGSIRKLANVERSLAAALAAIQGSQP